MKNEIYRLWLSSLTDVSLNSKARLLEAFGSAELAYHAAAGTFRQIEGISRKDAEKLEERDLAKAYEIINNCQKLGISYVTFDDAAYPKRLKEIYAAPDVLYYKGKIDALSANAPVAVIGTRKASAYGLKMARRMAYEISKCGGVVVSGLTAGADAAGAEGVLAAGGVCIGVLGTPVEKATGRLAQQVMESGAVISEYPPYTEQDRSFFRARNRIAAGISTGVVVAEAPEKSGTRLFVAEALEQGKEIFAVPGNADDENCAGTLRFIREGATLVTRGWEVAEALSVAYPGVFNTHCRETIEFHDDPPKTDKAHVSAPKSSDQIKNPPAAGGTGKKSRVEDLSAADESDSISKDVLEDILTGLTETQQKIVCAVNAGCSSVDEIIEETALGAPAVLSQLTILEIKGITARTPGAGVKLKAFNR